MNDQRAVADEGEKGWQNVLDQRFSNNHIIRDAVDRRRARVNWTQRVQERVEFGYGFITQNLQRADFNDFVPGSRAEASGFKVECDERDLVDLFS